MAVAMNDVNILSVETSDRDYPAGQQFDVTVEAEVGDALFITGGKYSILMTLVDRTNFKQVHSETKSGNYSDPPWKKGQPTTFTFTVPGTKTSTLDGSILEAQARVVGNAALPYDASHVLGETIQITPSK